MRFTKFHKQHFIAVDGAYSIVTDRERYDGQITLSDAETEIALAYFDPNTIHFGRVSLNPQQAQKTFKLYPSQEDISLNLIFPKPSKPELRLYIAQSRGFRPNAGDIWFLFISALDHRLHVGSMQEADWRRLGQTDLEDTAYQQDILTGLSTPEAEVKIYLRGEATVYRRDPKIALARFELSNFKCELNPNHETFLSTKGFPFVEAHHFIGMKFQPSYERSLDTIHNIFALCPTCHRAIHHATIKYRAKVVLSLFAKRPELQTTYALDEIDALYLYNCEDID